MLNCIPFSLKLKNPAYKSPVDSNENESRMYVFIKMLKCSFFAGGGRPIPGEGPQSVVRLETA